MPLKLAITVGMVASVGRIGQWAWGYGYD